MRISVGLVPDRHVCRWHALPMVSSIQPGPCFLSTGKPKDRLSRVIWRCVAPGCPFIICGAQGYQQGPEERKCISALGRDYA